MSIIALDAYSDNYIWVIKNPNRREFDCVDPGDANPVLQYAKNNRLQLRAILLTHHHFDHIGGVHELIQTYPNCRVYAPADSRIPETNISVHQHDEIDLTPYRYQVLSNPGHTSSHISYYEPKEHWLFCGDTLFSAGCGRVFDGSMEQLHHSINLFKRLPKETKVFCAHEYTLQNLRFAHSVEPSNLIIKECINTLKKNPGQNSLPSTIEKELQINPFFRTDAAEVIQYAQEHGAQKLDSYSVFALLRNEKNTFQ